MFDNHRVQNAKVSFSFWKISHWNYPITYLLTPGWLVSTLRPRPLKDKDAFVIFLIISKPFLFLNRCTMRQCVLLSFYLFQHPTPLHLNHIFIDDISVTEAGIFPARTGVQHLMWIIAMEMEHNDGSGKSTSPSRVGFVKSKGVPLTQTSRPVGIRAVSTSGGKIANTCSIEISDVKTCVSLAGQLDPVVGNSFRIAEVEIGVVGHIHHRGSGGHCSRPVKQVYQWELWVLAPQIEGSLPEGVGDRDKNIPREALITIGWEKAERKGGGFLVQSPFPHTLVPAPAVKWSVGFFFFWNLTSNLGIGQLPFSAMEATTWTHNIIQVQLKVGCFCLTKKSSFFKCWNLVILAFKGELSISNSITSPANYRAQIPGNQVNMLGWFFNDCITPNKTAGSAILHFSI